jgi:hypothetical protein
MTTSVLAATTALVTGIPAGDVACWVTAVPHDALRKGARS